jgi:hypothetical protein
VSRSRSATERRGPRSGAKLPRGSRRHTPSSPTMTTEPDLRGQCHGSTSWVRGCRRDPNDLAGGLAGKWQLHRRACSESALPARRNGLNKQLRAGHIWVDSGVLRNVAPSWSTAPASSRSRRAVSSSSSRRAASAPRGVHKYDLAANQPRLTRRPSLCSPQWLGGGLAWPGALSTCDPPGEWALRAESRASEERVRGWWLTCARGRR